jgi:hypothetical protein
MQMPINTSTDSDQNAATTDSVRRWITSVEQNLNPPEWSLDAAAVGLSHATAFCVSKQRLRGGRQEGVDLVSITTERLGMTVVPTRGMGILNVVCGDVRLEWGSPVKQVTHPHFVPLESRGGLGWLQGFNEWLVRCGLEFAGGPGRDKFVTNTGAVAEMDLTLHGKIANIPASEVEVLIDPAPPYNIRLRGRVDEVMFYGPKLELWSEIILTPGSAEFVVRDTITNRGGSEQEFEMLYHVNYGAPLLEEGSRFDGALRRVSPMNAHAAKSLGQFRDFQGPTAGFVEQVYCMEPLADTDGHTIVMLSNRAADRGVAMSYDVRQLPCFTLWKNTNVLEEGYVTGFEPGTNYPYNRRIERQAGRLGRLDPGESRTFAVRYSILSTKQEVEATRSTIASLQGTRPPELVPEPPRYD